MSAAWDVPLNIVLPRIQRIKAQGNFALYEIEPLQPGYGMTIAHALRRVLLSSLPGAAVIALRIEGISDVDQTLVGIKEDVGEIVLNVKRLRLRCFADHPVSVRLEMRGVCEVTGADLICPDAIEVVNPQCHLATLEQENAHLVLEVIVQAGRGYVPVDTQNGRLLGMIPVDAIYSPVRKAEYTVEHTRVGKMVNFDKVLFEVETDATITPDEALRQSGELLRKQFLVLAHPQGQTPEHRKATQSDVCIPPKIYNLPLEQLHLSVRSYNTLKRNGSITKVGQILTLDEEDLRGIRNVGDKVLFEIKSCLQLAGCFPRIGRFDSLPGQFQQTPAELEIFLEVPQDVQHLPMSGKKSEE